MSQGQTEHIKLTIPALKQQENEMKQRMMPLVRFLRKNGLKFKHAACMGARVEYFRMDSFNKLIEDKKQQLEHHPKIKQLLDAIKDDLVFFKRPQNTEKLKYPQHLIPSKTGTGKFASFKFDTTQSKRIYFYIVLAIIIAGVLFPLWPYELKYGLWLVSLYLLVTLVTLILIRIVLYIILSSLGISFWILPNLFGDYGLIDSFRPFYSVERWQKSTFSIIIRIASFALFAYYCHSIYTEPDFYLENFKSAQEVVQDVHDWGVGKIKGEVGNFSQRALTMDKILNQTADAFENETKEQYTSFNQDNRQTEL